MTYAVLRRAVAMRIIRTTVNWERASWASEAGREWEGDIMLVGSIGLIIIMEVPGVNASVTLIGIEGLKGDGAMDRKCEPVHVSAEGLLRDHLARCDILALHQATNAVDSASTFAGNATRLQASQTTRMLCSARNLHRLRVAMGMNLPKILLAACVRTLDRASLGAPVATPLSADHLNIWRDARMAVVSSSSPSCVEGRAYGPTSPRRATRHWNWESTASGGSASGSDFPRVQRRQLGCHPLVKKDGKMTTLRQPSKMAILLPSSSMQFEGVLRLGRRTSRPRLAAATLPPAPAAPRRARHGPAHRQPPSTPLPTLPGILSTPVSSKRAQRVAN